MPVRGGDTITDILRLAGLWLLATVTGFLLAAIAQWAFLLAIVNFTYQWTAQSQRELAILTELRFGVLVAVITVSAALRAAFQAGLLEARLRLGVAWLVASALAGLASFLLIAGIVHVLRPAGVTAIPFLPGSTVLTPIAGLFGGLAAWFVLRRLRRAPLLLAAVPVASLAAGVVLYEVARALEFASSGERLVAGALASGLVLGAVEGLALAWILSEPLRPSSAGQSAET